MKTRCEWSSGNPLMEKYHDEEWGTPVHDDQLLFEHLFLDTFQAGLSWLIILKKRENFRKAFDNFSIEKIARFDEKKIESLLNDEGIIRNKLKIRGAITNAQCALRIQQEFGSLDRYFWSFVNNKTIRNNFKTTSEIPAKTTVSDSMSKDMKKRGFKFAGSTVCYAFMQATGMINDHLVKCYRHEDLTGEH